MARKSESVSSRLKEDVGTFGGGKRDLCRRFCILGARDGRNDDDGGKETTILDGFSRLKRVVLVVTSYRVGQRVYSKLAARS